MTSSGKKRKAPLRVIVQHNPQYMLDDFYGSPGLARTIEWAKLQLWWEPWKRNFKASSDLTVNEFLDGLQSPANLIESAFQWSLTDEGKQYWERVHISLMNHISDEFLPFLIGIKGRITKDNEPFVISEEQFCELVGYGINVFTDDCSLEGMCLKAGLQLKRERDTAMLVFSLIS